MFSHDDMQFEMYRCTNSMGSSTAVVRRLTTSMECRLMSMLTSTEKYSLIWLDAWRSGVSTQHARRASGENARARAMSFSSASMAMLGLFSTSS